MKLYYTAGACSLAIRIAINELNISANYEEVDLRTKKTKSGADFLKINPKGAVPTLMTDDGQILTENVCIQQYLADKYQPNQLLPPINDYTRYRVLEWLIFITTELHKGFSPLFSPEFPDEIKQKIVIPKLKSKFDFMEKNLQQKKFLMGDTFTLPDIYLFVMLTWAESFKFDMTNWPNLSRYFSELKTRNSITKSLQEEKLKAEATS